MIEARSVFQYEPAPQPLPIHVAVHSIVYTHIDCLGLSEILCNGVIQLVPDREVGARKDRRWQEEKVGVTTGPR